jgi:hypothetical protein
MLVCLCVVFLAGCGDNDNDHGTPGPTPTPAAVPLEVMGFGGIYDVTTPDDPFAGHDDLVARVAVDDRGETSLAIFATSQISFGGEGILQENGSLALTGTASLPGRDFPARGRGAAAIDEQFRRIVLDAGPVSSAVDFAATFTLERPIDGDASPLGGRYRMAFAPSPGGSGVATTALLALDVNALGFATLALADEQDAAGATIGRLSSGDCRVSVSGRFACLAVYDRYLDPPNPGDPGRPTEVLFLFGRLPSADGTASNGRFEIDPASMTGLVTGTLTTTRE